MNATSDVDLRISSSKNVLRYLVLERGERRGAQ